MSARHLLSIEVLDTACPHSLKISDTSVYADNLGVDCARLDIWLPGFANPVYIPDMLHKGFIKSLSARDLGLQLLEDEPPRDLPDGLYKLAYSVAPTEYTKVEYYYLRQTLLLNSYYREIAKIQLAACELDSETLDKLEQLRQIKLYIDAAKAKAEYAQAPVQAIELMQYAERLLRKASTSPCSTC